MKSTHKLPPDQFYGEKVRLNLEVPTSLRSLILSLQQRSGATSMTEVLRRSLSLYDLTLSHIRDKGTIVLRQKDGSEELVRLL